MNVDRDPFLRPDAGADAQTELDRCLAAAESGPDELVDVTAAWQRFRRRRAAAATAPRGWAAMRPAWLGTAACVALVATTLGTLGFSSAARSATVRMLSWFRVTQVTALPMDSLPASGRGHSGASAAMRQMIADDVTVTLDEKSQPAADATQASRLAGFPVRYSAALAGLGAPRFRVQGGKDFHLTVDSARVQSLLEDAGVWDAQLPSSLNGAAIAVHIPRAVAVMYGDCALPPSDEHGLAGSPAGRDCALLGEAPSPAVSLPPGLQMEKIAEVGLQLLGMSAAEAHQYCQTVDWTSTLVVPFPRSEAQSRQVAVDGVSGILLTHAANASKPSDAARYFLLWSRQGMLYSVAGAGDGTQGLSLAADLN